MPDSVLGSVDCASAKNRSTWHLFLILVSLATLLPFIFAPLNAYLIPQGSPALYAYGVMAALGANFHVGLTGWFFTDPEMRRFFRSKPVYCIAVPCALIVTTTAAFLYLDSSVKDGIYIAFNCWLLWHYQTDFRRLVVAELRLVAQPLGEV